MGLNESLCPEILYKNTIRLDPASSIHFGVSRKSPRLRLIAYVRLPKTWVSSDQTAGSMVIFCSCIFWKSSSGIPIGLNRGFGLAFSRGYPWLTPRLSRTLTASLINSINSSIVKGFKIYRLAPSFFAVSTPSLSSTRESIMQYA